MHDQLSGLQQRPVADAVHIADDQIGDQAALQQSVAAPVDPHKNGLLLVEIVFDHPQILAKTLSPDDHHRLPILKPGPDGGKRHRSGNEPPLAIGMFQRVHHEILDDRPPLLQGALGELFTNTGGQLIAAGRGETAPVDRTPGDADELPLRESTENFLPQVFHQVHPPLQQVFYGQGGENPAAERVPVQNHFHPAAHQPLGGGPVEIAVGDESDLTGADSLQQFFGGAILAHFPDPQIAYFSF